MATVEDVIEGALKRLGVIEGAAVPSAEDAADALVRLNDLLDQFAAERLTIYTITRTTAAIVAAQASYTLGTGGNINRVRPMWLDHVNYIDTSTTPDFEGPLTPLTEDQYASLSDKTFTSELPTSYYYNPTFTTSLGTLIPYPIPTSATLQWAIYAPTAVPEFSAITDTVLLPPGYKRMLVTNLAVELAPDFGRIVPPELARAAMDSKRTVMMSNLKMMDLAFEAGAVVQAD